MSFDVNQQYPDIPRKRFPWGCLLGGCCVVMLLMAGGIGATGFMAYRFYKSQMARYTSDEPAELPAVDASESEIEDLKLRVESFKELVENEEANEPLELTEKEINMLISQNEDMSDKVYLRIEDDLLTADVSVPLDMLPGGEGRFFNGSVTLDAEIDNGRLEVYLEDADVQGEEIPSEILSQLSKENLAKDVNYDEDTKEWIERFESIEIVDNKIVLTPVKIEDTESKDDPEQSISSEEESSDTVSSDGEEEQPVERPPTVKSNNSEIDSEIDEKTFPDASSETEGATTEPAKN